MILSPSLELVIFLFPLTVIQSKNKCSRSVCQKNKKKKERKKEPVAFYDQAFLELLLMAD